MRYLMLAGMFVCLSSCGVIKGHSNPMINAGIKVVNKAVPEDGAIEERIEDVIEGATGLSIDLSPASPEADQ